MEYMGKGRYNNDIPKEGSNDYETNSWRFHRYHKNIDIRIPFTQDIIAVKAIINIDYQEVSNGNIKGGRIEKDLW